MKPKSGSGNFASPYEYPICLNSFEGYLTYRILNINNGSTKTIIK